MRIVSAKVPGWPGLGWVARVPPRSSAVSLLHGNLVEVNEKWAVEGVWAGEFKDGGFDRTSLVFGSGVRCRDESVVFVSSGSLLDRLFYCWDEEALIVANCLSALLANTSRSLLDSCTNYPALLVNNVRAPDAPVPYIPSDRGPLHFVYLHNLIYEDGRFRQLQQIPKPVDGPILDSFEAYRDYLYRGARMIGANAAAAMRTHCIAPVTTVTSGYDSVAAAVVSREAGCTHAVTIRTARALVPRSDSGAHIARHLGLTCAEYPRAGRTHPRELTFWSALGSTQDANLAVFEYPKPCCLLFTGVHGGRLWGLHRETVVKNLERVTDSCGLGFCEFRLWEGVIHCPVAFWGSRQGANIWSLSVSPDMARWRIGGDYDRPIPRRLAEEAGIPRSAFGIRKSATQFEESFLWPYRQDLSRSYYEYLKERGLPGPRSVQWCRMVNWIDRNFILPVQERWNLSRTAPIHVFARRSHHLLFQWSNHRLRDELRASIPNGVRSLAHR